MSLGTLLVAALFLVFSLVVAQPVAIEPRDVYVPPVLYPHSGTVWKVKQRHNVTWYRCHYRKAVAFLSQTIS